MVCLITLTLATNEPASLTRNFPGFKNQGQLLAVAFTKLVEAGREVLPQGLHIGANIIGPVGDLEAASQVDVVESLELGRGFEHNLGGPEEDFHIHDVGSGVHVYALHLHVVGLHDAMHMGHLVNGDAELGIDMAGGDLMIAACQYVGVDAHANRNVPAMYYPELLQDGDVVDVNAHAKPDRLLNFLDGDTVGGIEDVTGFKTGFQSQFNLLHGNRIQPRSQGPEQLQYIDVGKGLAGIIDLYPGIFKGIGDPPVLPDHDGTVIYI